MICSFSPLDCNSLGYWISYVIEYVNHIVWNENRITINLAIEQYTLRCYPHKSYTSSPLWERERNGVTPKRIEMRIERTKWWTQKKASERLWIQMCTLVCPNRDTSGSRVMGNHRFVAIACQHNGESVRMLGRMTISVDCSHLNLVRANERTRKKKNKKQRNSASLNIYPITKTINRLAIMCEFSRLNSLGIANQFAPFKMCLREV